MSEYAPVIILILETMMRGQEVLALTMDDIDLEKNNYNSKCSKSKI